MTRLPPILPVFGISERLQQIFPDGTPGRNYVTREMSAKTIFVMLYVGAVEPNQRWIRPDQVTRMTDSQASQVAERDREAWLAESMKRAKGSIEGQWYAANTREPIRDETLRAGLIRTGAVSERGDLPTTSSRPRYSLTQGFAALFDPQLTDNDLDTAILRWQESNLSPSGLARIAILRSGAVASGTEVMVALPNGQSRSMAAGPSSLISKAVLEEFAPRFLERPGLLWLSESGNKVVAQDNELSQAIGLTIDPGRNLPDMILVDLGADVFPPPQPLLVFIEVVATDGPITEARRAALLSITTEAGFSEDQVAFVTAYMDRGEIAFRRSTSELAWQSFAWFVSEPDSIVYWHAGRGTNESVRLSSLLGI